MRRLLLPFITLVVAVIAVFVLTGGDSSEHLRFGVHGASTPASCGSQVPLGQARMGVCAPQSIKVKLAPSSKPKVYGPQVIGMDVSDYDSCSAGTGARFLIIKDGEGSSFTAQKLACHIARAKQLGIPWGVYYFQRGGCQSCQADREVNLVASYGRPPLGYTVDDEVGVPAYQTQAFVNELYARTHRVPVRYTSPGLCTGHVNGVYLWIADYASSFSSCGGSQVLSWQFSDGVYGPYPHSVGGFTGDIDQDRGLIAAEGATPKPKPDKYAVLSARYVRIGHSRLSERASVVAFDQHHCARSRGAQCSHYRREIRALAGYLRSVAAHSKGDLSIYHRRTRLSILQRRS